MKKTLLTAIILTAMAMPLTSQAADEKLIWFDANRDGAINAVDASIVLSEYANISTGKAPAFNTTDRYVADTDGNGIINAVDASNILSTYAQNSTSKTPQPITNISFRVDVHIGNDIDNAASFNTYEDCLEWMTKDRAERKQAYIDGKVYRQSGRYEVYYCFMTYSKPTHGGSVVIQTIKFSSQIEL